MKYLPTIVLLAFATFLALPARAQRDANTSSARAAYSALKNDPNRGVKEKKNKKKAKKAKAPKTRKLKTKDLDLARARRSSLHF
jgi:hypothetical protein